MTARRSAAATGAAATAFLLPVLYSPSVDAPFWSPKAGFLLVIGAAGLTLLPALLRTSLRRPTGAAGAFLAVASLSTLLADAPAMALTGLYNWGTGLLFLAACVGTWCLGTSVPHGERRFVGDALVAGVAVSVAVGLAQALDVVPESSLASGNRVFGLAGNPIHFASLACAVVALGAHRSRRAPRWLGAVALGSVAVQLSGTRLALLVLVAVGIVGAVRAGRRSGPALLLTIALGVVAGTAIGELQGLTTAAARAASEDGVSVVSGGGSRVRLEVWSYARHAVLREPLLGSGPGRFRAATSADRTLTVARIEGGDAIYTDAHSILVEHLVTTGLVGTAALSLWLVLCFRRARGELAWAASAMLLMALAQPMSVGTTPVMCLCLGVAMSAPPALVHRRWAAAATLLGAILAASLVVGDFSLQQARLDFDLNDARRARSVMPTFPQPFARLAVIFAERGLQDDGALDTAVSWRQRALARDRSDPSLHVRLGDALQSADDSRAAREAYLDALRLNPWSTSAITQLALIAEREGDHAAAVGYARRGLRVRPNRTLQRLLNAKQPGP